MSNECDKYVNTRFKASDPHGVEYKNCQYEDTVDIEGSWSISDMFPSAHSIESVDGFSWK